MEQSHFHLLVNHLPIVGIMIGSAVLAGGFVFKNPHVKRTALFIIVFAGIAAFLANLTGEGAEEAVEEFEGVSHRVIHRHEEMGEKFLMVSILASVLSVVVLILDIRKKGIVKYLYPALLAVILFSCHLAYRTGATGGKIRRPELIVPSDTVRMKRPEGPRP